MRGEEVDEKGAAAEVHSEDETDGQMRTYSLISKHGDTATLR